MRMNPFLLLLTASPMTVFHILAATLTNFAGTGEAGTSGEGEPALRARLDEPFGVVRGPTMKPVGVITDRDIVCRILAKGKNPLEMRAKDCMSKPAITVSHESTIEECCQLMEQSNPAHSGSGSKRCMLRNDRTGRRGPLRVRAQSCHFIERSAASGAHKVIQKRAYQLYVEGGNQPGRELENWILAEREFAGQRRRSVQLAGP